MAWVGDPKTWAFQEGVESTELNIELRDRLRQTWHVIARKLGDTALGASLADVPDLSFPVAANDVWLWRVVLRYTNSSSISVSWGFPTGGVMQHSAQGYLSGGGSTVTAIQRLTVTDGASFSLIAQGGVQIVQTLGEGMYVNGSTPGTVALRASSASGTINSNCCIIGLKLI